MDTRRYGGNGRQGNCGRQVRITRQSTGKTITATVADACPVRFPPFVLVERETDDFDRVATLETRSISPSPRSTSSDRRRRVYSKSRGRSHKIVVARRIVRFAFHSKLHPTLFLATSALLSFASTAFDLVALACVDYFLELRRNFRLTFSLARSTKDSPVRAVRSRHTDTI